MRPSDDFCLFGLQSHSISHCSSQVLCGKKVGTLNGICNIESTVCIMSPAPHLPRLVETSPHCGGVQGSVEPPMSVGSSRHILPSSEAVYGH